MLNPPKQPIAFEMDKRPDPVSRLVRNIEAREMVQWLVQYHGLPESSAETVESNLREQFKWHRLQGRLDARPIAAVIAELFAMRHSPMILNTPTGASE